MRMHCEDIDCRYFANDFFLLIKYLSHLTLRICLSLTCSNQEEVDVFNARAKVTRSASHRRALSQLYRIKKLPFSATTITRHCASTSASLMPKVENKKK